MPAPAASTAGRGSSRSSVPAAADLDLGHRAAQGRPRHRRVVVPRCRRRGRPREAQRVGHPPSVRAIEMNARRAGAAPAGRCGRGPRALPLALLRAVALHRATRARDDRILPALGSIPLDEPRLVRSERWSTRSRTSSGSAIAARIARSSPRARRGCGASSAARRARRFARPRAGFAQVVRDSDPTPRCAWPHIWLDAEAEPITPRGHVRVGRPRQLIFDYIDVHGSGKDS